MRLLAERSQATLELPAEGQQMAKDDVRDAIDDDAEFEIRRSECRNCCVSARQQVVAES